MSITWRKAVALAKVQGRGQITLPHDVREEARIKPGDVLNVYVIGPGQLKVDVVPQLDISAFFDA
jgi:AbrB family looped-hinge helix DNA binding protein